MTEYRCPRCGKNFIPAYYHVYKDCGHVFCSWTCYNHRGEVARRSTQQVRRVEMYDVDGRLIASFASARAAAFETGFCPAGIWKAIREKTAYKGFYWKHRDQGEDAE